MVSERPIPSALIPDTVAETGGSVARFEGSVAIVTGGATGMGATTARVFAGEGARVVVADVNDEPGEATAAAIRSAGGEAVYAHTDVSSEGDVERMVAVTEERFGRLDFLFNNAGIARAGTITTQSEADWDAVLAIDLKGVWLGMKHAIPAMCRSGGGAIVNNASYAGLRGSVRMAAYGAAKAGVINLTRSAAAECGPWNVRVNCICPGSIRTELPAHTFGLTPEENDAWWERAQARIPLGRVGDPEEIARVVLFLCSKEASYLTGVILPVDAGMTAAYRPRD
jgi:NAD(P)-dependent dehydrogenase (short-subunit alcohol dehydrogenase family)